MNPEHLQAIAVALYEHQAPRYGNGIRPFEELGDWEQRKFLDYARIAVEKWESLKA